jgi:DNA-binding GntR family transcriptional regulator
MLLLVLIEAGMSETAMSGINNVVPQGKVQSARALAYEALKVRLMTLDIAPNSVIDVSQLTRQLSVGRTPLVEALQRLALEGFLTIHPRRGTVVTEPSFAQAQHVFEVRDALEGRSARLAARRAREEDVQSLHQLNNERRVQEEAGNYRQYLLQDYEFHLMIARISGNPFLQRALDHLLALNIRMWACFYSFKEVDSQYTFPHESILKAIEQRDPDAAEHAMVDHIVDAKTLLLTMFQ